MFLQGFEDREHVDRATCPHCHRDFECIEFEGEPGGRMDESIHCPYDGCGKFVETRRSSGTFRTRRIISP